MATPTKQRLPTARPDQARRPRRFEKLGHPAGGWSHSALPSGHSTAHSEEHLPPGWKERFAAWIDWTWAFVLDDLGNGKTRFIFRSRLRTGPLLVAAAYQLAIIPADFVMSRQMIRGVKARAERATAADLLAAAQPAEPARPG